MEALKLRAWAHVAADRSKLAIRDMRAALVEAPHNLEIMRAMAMAHDRGFAGERLALAVETSGLAPEESLRHARFPMGTAAWRRRRASFWTRCAAPRGSPTFCFSSTAPTRPSTTGGGGPAARRRRPGSHGHGGGAGGGEPRGPGGRGSRYVAGPRGRGRGHGRHGTSDAGLRGGGQPGGGAARRLGRRRSTAR